MADYSTYSKEELLKLIAKQEKELKAKKYGLVWDNEREPEQVVLDCENNLPILKRITTKEIRTDDSEDNILIEGDNYHALTVLNYTHREKIDVIYIDPPYNTGNKDFIYNDRYVDKEDGYRHSKWLNFMEKRLKLAKPLLKKDGVLFCSIDDNEYPRLIMLLENIFGEDKVKTICVKMSEPTGVKMAHIIANGGIAKLKEYLVIAKVDGIKNIYLDKIPKEKWDDEYKTIITNATEEQIKKVKSIRDNEYRTKEDVRLCNKIVDQWSFSSLSEYFKTSDITTKKEKDNFKYKNAWRIIQIATITGGARDLAVKEKTSFKNTPEFFVVTTPQNKLYIIKGSFNHETKLPRCKVLFADDYLTVHPGDFWSDIKTTGLDNEGKVHFTNGKKPIKLLERLINSIEKEKITVLDFFAGSGTMGEVVLKLRRENIKNINYIICTNNEEQICNNVTYPRQKYAIKKYGGNLQYFKTSLIKKTKNRDQVKIDLTRKCTEMLCVKENIFNLEKEADDFKIFSSNKKDRFLCVYYNFIDDTFEDFLNELKKLKGKKYVYMFSLENEVDKSLFVGVKDLKIAAIPQNILDVYKQLVKMNIPLKTNIIFTDFNKAKNKIFVDKDKDDGARVLRVVLEKVIQKVAQNNSINILNAKGKEEKVATLNSNLFKKNVITKVEWTANTTFLAIGNNAAHGDYDDYDLKQVEKFYQHVQGLLNSYDM